MHFPVNDHVRYSSLSSRVSCHLMDKRSNCCYPLTMFSVVVLPGDQVASYQALGFGSSVSCVCFHPHDHLVAFCSLADDSPVHIYKYDHQGTLRDAMRFTISSVTACGYVTTQLKITELIFVHYCLVIWWNKLVCGWFYKMLLTFSGTEGGGNGDAACSSRPR